MRIYTRCNDSNNCKGLLDLPMRSKSFPRDLALAFFLLLMFVCYPTHAAVAEDPLEQINRGTHSFNSTVDNFVLKPLAVSYQRFTPGIVKTGLRNFFSNLDDVRVSINDLLQLEFAQAASDMSRFAVNSTLGAGGLMNVAGDTFGLEKHHEDFGMTLAHWGVGAGPYVVLPLLGPSTLRDAFGISFDTLVDPLPAASHVESRNSLIASRSVDYRSRVLSFDDLRKSVV